MGLDDRLADAQPEPRSALLDPALELAEAREQLGLLLGGDALARVHHRAVQARLAGLRPDRDALALGGELDGVAQEVDEHLLDALRVHGGPQGGRRQIQAQLEPGGLELRAEALGALADLEAQIRFDGLEPEGAGVEAGEVQKVVHQGLEAPGALLDLPDVIPLRLAQHAAHAVLQELGVAHDRGQGHAQVVGDGVDEVVLEVIEAPGGFELAARLLLLDQQALALGLGALALGHVASDHQHPLAASVRVEQGDLDRLEDSLRTIGLGDGLLGEPQLARAPGLLVGEVAAFERRLEERAPRAELQVGLALVGVGSQPEEMEALGVGQDPAPLAVLEEDHVGEGLDQGIHGDVVGLEIRARSQALGMAAEQADPPAFRIGPGAPLAPVVVAVLGAQAVNQAGDGLARPDPVAGRERRGALVGVDQREEHDPREVLGGVAEEPGEGRVDLLGDAVGAHQADRFGREREHAIYPALLDPVFVSLSLLHGRSIFVEGA
ncbi:hypothetical protein D3C86_1121240 [compost metagenome]